MQHIRHNVAFKNTIAHTKAFLYSLQVKPDRQKPILLVWIIFRVLASQGNQIEYAYSLVHLRMKYQNAINLVNYFFFLQLQATIGLKQYDIFGLDFSAKHGSLQQLPFHCVPIYRIDIFHRSYTMRRPKRHCL